ncbi:glycosyltransferase family 4 protein [Candidatus Microgenomates bacterium]|nr:MAG: glycosyltransferase family 4 protein [Candidatus Microgenomates bacterium]
MKVALVHDYIKEYGGAERVLETLHEIYPDAPVYTTVYLPKFLGPHRERFEGRMGELGESGKWDIRTSLLQNLPFKAKLISPIRLISPIIFGMFDFSKFDVVIVSATGAYFPNSIRIKKQELRIKGKKSQRPKTKDQPPVHVCYCHTPPRYLYGYATAREWKKNIFLRVVGEIMNHFLRLVDYKSAQNVDYFIANSKNVEDRISKFYRKESTIIYPPIDIKSNLKSQISNLHLESKNYFICGGRLARAKHTDIIVRACRELNIPLKIFGKGFAGYEQELRSMNYESGKKNHNSKIEFVGEVSDEEKLELMRGAKAFIFASEDEDFGITPVEAMSVGTPIIAYRSGGVKETVVDGKTGIFFNELTVESLCNAIKHYDNTYYHSGIKPGDCIKQAQNFSKEKFKQEIKNFVNAKANSS